jgi:3-oxoacyl-[acyl-carrier-protein] synthase I
LKPLRITAYTVCSAAGDGREHTLASLRDRRSGLSANDFGPTPLATWIGRVAELERQPLPKEFAQWDCRNNRLAWRGLNCDAFLDRVIEARERYGASRIAVVVGTSTSSIGASEEAYRRLTPDKQYPEDLRRPIIHMPHSLGDFIQHALGLNNVSMTVATACSSSAKVFAQAQRLIQTGLADAVVIGGVDTLCDSVIFGFNSLELISPERCRPFDRDRRGINIGEAAGFALIEREGRDGSFLLGCGESSDAHHMSTPHPEGLGARLALESALRNAALQPEDVGYINLHGTATRKNDEVEAKVVSEVFPSTTFASSTKGWTGHTLGAAGIVEAAISLLALEHGLLPGTLNSEHLDEACGPQVQLENATRDVSVALSFSFGFGGSNCVLALGRSDAKVAA